MDTVKHGLEPDLNRFELGPLRVHLPLELLELGLGMPLVIYKPAKG